MRRRVPYRPAILLLVFILLNILSQLLYFRIDATSHKQYSLSPATRELMRSLKKDVTVYLYASEDLNREELRQAKTFIHLLNEYQNKYSGNFTIHTVHINTNEKRVEAIRQGIQSITIETTEQQMVKIRHIMLGAVIQVGDVIHTIPYINKLTPMEYEITRTLKKAMEYTRPRIGFISGHNELPLSMLSQMVKEISTTSDVEYVYIDHFSDLSQYKVICLIGPTDYLHPVELAKLDEYLDHGGRMFIALNHAIGKSYLTPGYGFINRVGIEELLEDYGLKIKYNFVIDQHCHSSAENHIFPLDLIAGKDKSPYIPMINNFSKHPITHRLNAICLQYASSIEEIPSGKGYNFTWLAKTSARSGTLDIPVTLDPLRKWTTSDFNKPFQTVAALLTHEKKRSAIVVVTDADFLRNTTQRNIGQHYHNTHFAVNAIEWLADDSGLIELRSKLITTHHLKPISYPTRTFIRYFNFFFPLLLLAAMVFFLQRNRF